MSNSIFIDKQTGEKVRILNEDSNFYVLDNNVSIKKEIFSKKYDQLQEIDPTSFFTSKVSNDPLLNLANQLKTLDTSKISDSETTGTKVKYTPPVVISDTSLPNGIPLKQEQEDKIILTPDQKKALLDDWRKTQPGAQIPAVQERNWNDDDERMLNGDKPIIPKSQEPKVDPMQMMFKMFKNNYPVKISVSVDGNIPSPQFIGIIQENIEADAIKYYSDQISDKILKDPEKLKAEIYNQLKCIVNKELGEEDCKEDSEEEKNNID